MKQLLVTGLDGFVGRHLQAYLAEDNDRGWQLWAPAEFDLLQPHSLDRLLKQGCPAAVIHLAGQTFVPEAFRDPAHTLQVNLIGTLNLLLVLKSRGLSGTFLYVSSGDVNGQPSTVYSAQILGKAVHLEAGQNDVLIRYVTHVFYWSAGIIAITCLLVLGLLLVPVAGYVRRPKLAPQAL